MKRVVCDSNKHYKSPEILELLSAIEECSAKVTEARIYARFEKLPHVESIVADLDRDLHNTAYRLNKALELEDFGR